MCPVHSYWNPYGLVYTCKGENYELVHLFSIYSFNGCPILSQTDDKLSGVDIPSSKLG